MSNAPHSNTPANPRDVDGGHRVAAILAHLSAPIAAIVSVGWLNWAGPLIVWLLYRSNSPFVRTAAAQSFNYQVTMWLTSIIGWVLIFTVVLSPVGIVMVFVGNILAIVLGVWGAIRTAGGHQYRYPWNLPILK